MRTKFLSVITTSLLFSTFSNYAYSQEMMSTKPVVKKETKMVAKTPKKAVTVDFNQSEEWKNIRADNVKSSRDLIMMGAKIVSDANMSNESEKMLMGYKMILSGLEIMGHMYHGNKHSHVAKGKKMPEPLSNDMYLSIEKTVVQSSAMLFRMGHKLVKEGNTNKEGQKMMTGGELIHSGIDLRHTMKNIKMSTKNKENTNAHKNH